MKFFIKACVHYFLTNFYLSPNGSPSKTMNDIFYIIISLSCHEQVCLLILNRQACHEQVYYEY